MSGAGKKRILFVDDEAPVLAVLQALMRRMMNEWETSVASDGAEALALMDRQPFDVVVSDMRMPGMSGAQLLNEVMRRHPKAVRIVLSGHADERTVQETVGVAHQWLAKPFDPGVLSSILRRVSASHDWLNDRGLKELVGRLTRLPSAPHIYYQILESLQSPDCSMQVIADVIARDPALTAKILKLVNSAFFGMAREISSATEAVQLLGVSRIRSLALTHHIFSAFDQHSYAELSVDEIWHHSLQSAVWARQLARWQGNDRSLEDLAFTGGLLHDIGRLILAANLPAAYRQICAEAHRRSCPHLAVEREILHATHADVGAYLLTLWGLPLALVETVALHHEPALTVERAVNALTAVHVASVWSYERTASARIVPGTPLDADYLTSLGLSDRVAQWRPRLETA